MATDIQNITAGAGGGSTAYFTASIKSGTVVVQAPMKTFGTNNFIGPAKRGRNSGWSTSQ